MSRVIRLDFEKSSLMPRVPIREIPVPGGGRGPRLGSAGLGGNTPMIFHFLGVPSESEFRVFIGAVPHYSGKHSEMDGADKGVPFLGDAAGSTLTRTGLVPVEMTGSRRIRGILSGHLY